jgi:MoaA/NifB/PqqE/SkfB family radical SAM enzyme
MASATGMAEPEVVGFAEPQPVVLVDWTALKDTQVNVYNFAAIRAEPPALFGIIRFDPNNTCNLRCVYCHNPRSDETIATEDFRDYLETRVVSAFNFQIGCIMEPTLDHRLADLMLLVAQSPARPRRLFMLQTNGILLHRHDLGKMREAGLTYLSVSVDAAEPATQRELRNGTSLERVVRNVAAFRSGFPEAQVGFITTVTAANVGKMAALVALGLGLGVSEFTFREVFYYAESPIVDHSRMPGLLLEPGRFAAMREELVALFGAKTSLVFADEARLAANTEKMKADSGFA